MPLIILGFIILILLDMRKLLHTSHRVKTAIIYFAFIAAALTISLLMSSDHRPSSPAEIIEEIFTRWGVTGS